MTTTTPATALSTHVLRLNSIYDPSFTSGGVHQPAGRDAFIAFGYKYYRVLKTTVSLLWANTLAPLDVSLSMNKHTCVGYALADDPALSFSDWRAFSESKQTSPLILRSTNIYYDGSQRVAGQNYTYTPEAWDMHVQESGVEERWTPVGANPPNLHYLILNSGPGAAHTNSTSVEVYVHITYTVQFREIAHITTIDTT